MASSLGSIPGSPRPKGGARLSTPGGRNYGLLAICVVSGALAIFCLYSTWLGVWGYTGPRQALLASIALQGLVFVFAWLLAFALVRRQGLRVVNFTLLYLIAAGISLPFFAAALYFNLSSPRSLQSVADLDGPAAARQMVAILDKTLTEELSRAALAIKEAREYSRWSSSADALINASSQSEGRINEYLAGQTSARQVRLEQDRSDLTAAEAALADAQDERTRTDEAVRKLEAQIGELTQRKQQIDAKVAGWDAQVAAKNREIDREVRGEGSGKNGCGDVCKKLQGELLSLMAARTPEVSQQGALIRQFKDLEARRPDTAGQRDQALAKVNAASQRLAALRARVAATGGDEGTPLRLAQLQTGLRDARTAFRQEGAPEHLNTALEYCSQIQQAMGAVGSPAAADACTLTGLDNERQQLQSLALAHTQFEKNCRSADPFQRMGFEAAMARGAECLQILQQAGIEVTEQQKLLQRKSQDYGYLALIKDGRGFFTPNLRALRTFDKVQIALNGLFHGDWKATVALVLAVLLDVLIVAAAWGGALAQQGAREAGRDSAPQPSLQDNVGDDPQVRALKLILRSVGTENGEQVLEIDDPCRHSDIHIKDIANQLVARRDLLTPRRGGRYYRLVPGAYERIKDQLRHALSATVTVLPPKLGTFRPRADSRPHPKGPPRAGRSSFLDTQE